jgi:hypothetical protein
VRAEAIATADAIITVTGARNVLTAADLPHLKDGVVLVNAGHFPWEIDVAGMESSAMIDHIVTYQDEITTWHLRHGRQVHLLGRGHMVNLAGLVLAWSGSGIVGGEDGFDWLVKQAGDLEGQAEAGLVFAGLGSVDRLARYP